MRNLVICAVFAAVASIVLTACGGGEQPSANKSPNANAPANKANSQSNLTTVAKTPEAAANDAPTLGPVYKGLCDAIAKKDDAGARKVYSSAALKQLEADMKAENEKSIVAYLETDQITDCQVSNEKIEGDSGSLLVKTKGAPNGVRLKFVKENGEWKFTGESADVQSVRQSAGNTNSAR